MTLRLSLRRAPSGLALALALAGAPPLLADGGEEQIEQGSAAYAELCSGCHANAARIVRRVEGGTDAERGGRLDSFLKEHHAPDDAQRAALIAYLLSL